MIESHLPAVSTYAKDIDSLILLIGVLVGFWFFVCQGMFFWLMFKFRAREGHRTTYVTGEEKELARWVHIPHYLVLVCDLFIIVGAVRVWYDVKQNLPEPDATVRVIGQQWAWTFVQPGPDGQLDTPDDIRTVDNLHIEVGKTYHYKLESKDVLHNFSVPVFRLKQDAVPGRVITGWFEATRTGEFDIQCAEICGIGHGIMKGRIKIQSPEEHSAWMAQNSTPAIATASAE